MDKKDDTGLSQNLCCFFILFHPDYHCRLWIHTKSADFEKNMGKITRTFVSNARGLTLTRSPPVGTFTLP
jgi:hypothetical protein